MASGNSRSIIEPRFSFSLLKTVDNLELLPTYSAVLKESKEDRVSVEDLDALQLELEALLSAVVLRGRVFQRELNAVENSDQNKKVQPKRRSCPLRSARVTPFKRIHSPTQILIDKSQPLKVPNVEKTVSPKLRKNSNMLDLAYCEMNSELHDNRISAPKIKHVSKFWQSVDRFCRPLNQNDLTSLQELIKAQENIVSSSVIIPPLGDHYTVHWATKELQYQKSASNSQRNRSSITSSQSITPFELLKKGQEYCQHTQTPEFVSLPSTILANVNQLLETDFTDPYSLSYKVLNGKGNRYSSLIEDDTQHSCPSVHKPLKNSSMEYFEVSSQNVEQTLETRLKKDLVEIDEVKAGEVKRWTDGVVMEIKRCEGQMKSLAQNNMIRLEHCLELSKKEIKRQEFKKKLRDCDSAILDIYQKIQQCKLKGQSPKKHHQELASKLLKDRESLKKSLDVLYS